MLGDRPLAIEGGPNPGNQTGKQPGGNNSSGANQSGKQPQDNQNSSSGTSVSQGRVAEPGGQPDKLKAFQDNTQVPEKYRNDPRFEELATDPDKGNKVIPASRAEAMALNRKV